MSPCRDHVYPMIHNFGRFKTKMMFHTLEWIVGCFWSSQQYLVWSESLPKCNILQNSKDSSFESILSNFLRYMWVCNHFTFTYRSDAAFGVSLSSYLYRKRFMRSCQKWVIDYLSNEWKQLFGFHNKEHMVIISFFNFHYITSFLVRSSLEQSVCEIIPCYIPLIRSTLCWVPLLHHTLQVPLC